jgi:transposase
MPSAEVEVLSVQRRRRFTAEEKQRLVAETNQPGMNVSMVARRHGISPSRRKRAEAGSLSAVGAFSSASLGTPGSRAAKTAREKDARERDLQSSSRGCSCKKCMPGPVFARAFLREWLVGLA